MLNMHCPICNCPLLRRKGESVMLCVSCNRQVITEKELVRREQEGEKLDVEDPSHNGSQSERTRVDVNEVVETDNKDKKKTDTEDRFDDDDDDDDDDKFWKKPSPEQFARQRRQDEISDMLGARMLMGWAMLGQHCKECSTTLLRSRDGVIECVACKRTIGTGVDSTDEDVSVPAAKEVVPQRERGEVARLDHAKGTTGGEGLGGHGTGTLVEKATGMDEKGRFRAARDSRTAADTGHLNQVLNVSKDILTRKIENVNQNLETSTDPMQISALARVITDLATALAAVRKANEI
eukprot:CAMPEP_0184480278 /NCGR_PEP_ID=MMETSP0113_2-20130426/1780_1 /TAXON_ID=91329 /ORGANISM="Norrisiella sphaerica, Strain BC52" /LENGTH=292 /DNA_ID=CAMNT_0026858659 /DNA_START=97 /DNA_END=975 /DNA_ORIENTATION=-